MQSTRSNLQLKLIDDARKLLEKVRTEDGDAPSIGSSISSLNSRKKIQKSQPFSPPKFADVVFMQKQISQESDEESVGNMSCSQAREVHDTDSSAMSTESVLPRLANLSFASSLSKDSSVISDDANPSTSSGVNRKTNNADDEDCNMDNTTLSQGKHPQIHEEKGIKSSENAISAIRVSLSSRRKKIVLGNVAERQSSTSTSKSAQKTIDGSNSIAKQSVKDSNEKSRPQALKNISKAIRKAQVPKTDSKSNGTLLKKGAMSGNVTRSCEDTRIENLKHQNFVLRKENQNLQYNMNNFDEKLACLEATLGIISMVEKNRTEFDLEAERHKESEDPIDRKIEERDSTTDIDTNSCSNDISFKIADSDENSCQSIKSEKSMHSLAIASKNKREENNKSDDDSYQSEYSDISNTSKNRQNIGSSGVKHADQHDIARKDSISPKSTSPVVSSVSKELEHELLNSDDKSYLSAVSKAESSSQKSISTYGSARSTRTDDSHRSKDSNKASLKENTIISIVERDENNATSRTLNARSLSKVTTSIENSLSTKERKELEMLRDNNEKMLVAIKALSKATTIQTRKHYHYKKKLGFTKKDLHEGNQKISKLIVDNKEKELHFYEARANYLEEQDKREALSDAVQELAKKMNGLRKELNTKEETTQTILEQIDETSFSSSSDRSIPSVTSSSVSLDSLDMILSPVSENERFLSPINENEPHFVRASEEIEKENLETKQTPSILTLELEIAKLKGKLDKKQNQIKRLRNNFKLVKEYLDNKETN